MESAQRNLPRNVFVHLLMIATLYASATAFLALIFQYINVVFPDALGIYYPGILDTIRRATATLLIVFPVYLFLSWLIGRDMIATPGLRDFKLRKWLVYFTLFISAITIIVDLVTLIYNFLSGDLTASFVFKVLAVLATAAGIFGYYLWDLRAAALARSRFPRIAAGAAAVIVLTSLIAGFLIVGSPATQRQRRFDDQRIQDLQTLQSQIVNYWTLKQKLPDSLDELKDSISGFTAPVDPETGQPYEYRTGDKLTFQLCADFRIASALSEQRGSKFLPTPAMPYGRSGDVQNKNWTHGAGRACFSRTIDPELYKPQKPILQ